MAGERTHSNGFFLRHVYAPGQLIATLHSSLISAVFTTILISPAVVDIGFQSLEFISTENSSATVCAQIDRGSLEREVVVYLSTVSGGTAVGK